MCLNLLEGSKSDSPGSSSGGTPSNSTPAQCDPSVNDTHNFCADKKTTCKHVSNMGVPVSPKGDGRKISMWGEGEAPGFEDFAANERFAKFTRCGKEITRPVSSAKPQPPGLPDKSASDICLRSAPLDSSTLSELKRIAKPGARITFASTKEGMEAFKKKLLDTFPGAKVVEECSWCGGDPVIVIEVP
jgi:hypothetical protein